MHCLQVMGHMDVVSIVSDYFNVYFPIALLALTLATYFSLGARILSGERRLSFSLQVKFCRLCICRNLNIFSGKMQQTGLYGSQLN